jgi:tape measure domain-containing protein
MADDKKTLELQIRIAADEALRAVSSLKGEMTSLAGEMKKLSGSDGAAMKKTFEETRAAAEKAAASMKLFGVSSGELRQMQAQVKAAAVDLVANGLDPENAEVRKLTEEYKRLGKEAGDLDRATGKNISSFGDLKNALGSLAQVAALTKALTTIKDMGAFALTAADTFQTARNEFGILLGDMEAGAGLFNEIKAFNDKTPFSLDTLKEATSVLLAAKVPLADLQGQLTKFGDLSRGNAQRFTSYINAFSKAAAKGKADMETLNTYINQGVPILTALGNRFGVVESEIVEMVSQGKISFKDFSAALDDLTAAGGQYFGGMERGSQSLAAMQEGLKESVNTLAASFGELLLPAAIEVVGALTDITDAINESPVLKGVFAGALVAITGYLAAMAVKAGVAFAAQMGLNLAIGAINPVVAAATVAVGIAAAGYTLYASNLQKAKREAEDFALEQRKQRDAVNDSAAALQRYSQALAGMTDADIGRNLSFIQRDITAIEESLGELEGAYQRARAAGRQNLADYWSGLIDQEQKNLARARADLVATLDEQGRRKPTWQEWFGEIAKIDPVLIGSSGQKAASLYLENFSRSVEHNQNVADALGSKLDIADLLRKQQADIQKAITDLISIDPGSINQPFEFTNEVIKSLVQRFKDLGAAVHAVEHQAALEGLRKKIEDLGKSEHDLALESAEAAGASAEELAALKALMDEYDRKVILQDYREQVEGLTQDTYDLARAALAAAGANEEETRELEEYIAVLKKADLASPLEAARQGLADWQQSVADSTAQALMDIEGFSAEAAVILGDLSAAFTSLAASAALSGFEEFGRAMGEGKDAAASLERALAEMGQQILRQLPTMFLQAGLQLIANGQWPLGLGFIAAAGLTAITSGFVDGTIAQAKKDAAQAAEENAKGGVYGEYGRAAREYAAGGAFTNRVVSQPTYFRYGGGLGVMGEAGPEAIMPLVRGGDGRLGVSTFGGEHAGAAVYVIIQNYTNEEVRTEESSDGAGNQIRRIVIGAVKQSISSGEMDQPLSSRFGLRARGI